MSELNKKIQVILTQSTEGLIEEAANEIEILVLNDRIELLTGYRDEFMNRFLTSSAATLNMEIDRLTKIVNKLTQQND